MKNFIFSISKLYECKKYVEEREEKCKKKIEEPGTIPKWVYKRNKQLTNERIGELTKNSQILNYLSYICDFAIETAKLYEGTPKSKYDDFKQLKIDL